jgi:hypothetical protein
MNELQNPVVENVTVTEDTLSVELRDGRTIAVPLTWFPRLVHATPSERQNWRLIGRGEGIHWEELDEDISVANLLLGRPSGESQRSLEKWLASRSPSQQELNLGKGLALAGRGGSRSDFDCDWH